MDRRHFITSIIPNCVTGHFKFLSVRVLYFEKLSGTSVIWNNTIKQWYKNVLFEIVERNYSHKIE